MRRSRLLAAALTALCTGVAGLTVATPAQAAGRWAPAEQALITPGVQMYTDGAQCTANFVFTDADRRVYVGYAAHCAGTGEATDTNGCDAASLPLGTRVRFARGGSLVGGGETVGRGRLVYSSWLTMQRRGTTKQNACAYNDFALVRVGAKHVGKVNPTVPFWGGPVGLRTEGTLTGDEVYSFGSSSLRSGLTELAPKVGTSLGSWAGGWSHDVYTASPGVPGDSGSGFLDAQGRAIGTLSTLALAPFPGSNGVSDLAHELRFAQRHSGLERLRLVRGTEPFSPVL
jgi:hypothetical protein